MRSRALPNPSPLAPRSDDSVKDYDGTELGDGEPASGFAAVPDAFQRLWTPHRMAYISSNSEQAPRHHDCPFCEAPALDDESALIVARGTLAYVLLNLYPYNTGHLLVCPYRHVATYDEATTDEIAEIGSLTQEAMRVLRQTASVDGFNIGMNQGRIAGAGIAEHLHQHIVPRWAFDSNFFPIIAGTKAVPRLLGEVRTEIANAWPTHDQVR
jgi:ATP adenylyltransferase